MSHSMTPTWLRPIIRWLGCAISNELFGIHNVKCFGARGDGVLDDTTPIQNAIDTFDGTGGIVYFPPGTYCCRETLQVGNNVQIVGAGRDATRLQFIVTGDTPAIARSPKLTGQWKNFVLRDLSIFGTDGSGGYGLQLESAVGALIDNVWIDRFRSPDGDGCGLHIIASSEGNCAWNRFDHLDIANCDTGLLMDSEVGSPYACGYMTFTALTVHQQRDCVVLKNSASAGNGSKYNRFFGLTIQGIDPVKQPPGGHFLVIEGGVNHLVSFVIDEGRIPPPAPPPLPHIWFRTGASGIEPAGNRVSGGNFSYKRVLDENPRILGGNTLDHSGTFAGGGRHAWWLNDREVAPPHP
jgi:hypothetical protein